VARLFGGKIFLVDVARPRTNDHPIRIAPRDGDSVVGALRIDNDDFVGPADRFKRGGDVRGFVVGDDRDGQVVHRPRV
jgi:hypothetical protein